MNASAYVVADSMPRSLISPRNSSSSNQCLADWLGKCSRSNASFSCDDLLVEWDENVGRAEIAVVLGDLVLEDQVVAKRVPCELAGEPVILMEVGASVREDQIRLGRP